MAKKLNRVTKVEKERRILEAQSWMIDGHPDDFILRQISKNYNLSTRQAKRYLNEAYERWKPDEKLTIEHKRARSIARLQKIARDMSQEFRNTPQGVNALGRIERQIARLEGTEMPKRHHIEGELKTEIKPTRYIDATLKNDRDS